MDIDDTQSGVPQVVCPIIKRIDTKKVYRVSWIIADKRKEEFFEKRVWANKRARDLQNYADELQVKVDVLVGEIELRGENDIPTE